MDAHPTRGERLFLKLKTEPHSFTGARDCERFFHAFLRALRTHRALENAHIVLCGERNTGHEVQYLSEMLEMFSNKSIISQRGDGDEGWWTDPFNKQRMLDDGDRALLGRGTRMMEDWAVTEGFSKDSPDERRKKVLDQFESELMRYGEHERPTNDASLPPKVFISGRVGEDGRFEKSARDDLAFSFCFSVWLNRKIMRRIAPGVNYPAIFNMPARATSGTTKRKRTL